MLDVRRGIECALIQAIQTEFHQKIILRNKNIGKTKQSFGTNYVAAIKMKAIFTYDFYRTLIELFFAQMPCNRVIDHSFIDIWFKRILLEMWHNLQRYYSFYP